MTDLETKEPRPRIIGVEDALFELKSSADLLGYLTADRFDRDDERRFDLIVDAVYVARGRVEALAKAYTNATGQNPLANIAALRT